MEHTKQQSDWAIALRFYPDLSGLEVRLYLIDPDIVADFKASLLASKQYQERQALADQIEQAYLEKFFGGDPLIIDFARDLLLAGRRDGAKELNSAIKVVGKSISSERIIEQLASKYLPNRPMVKRQDVIKVQQKPSTLGSRIMLIIVIAVIVAAASFALSSRQELHKPVSEDKPRDETPEQRLRRLLKEDELRDETSAWIQAIGGKVRRSWVLQTNEQITCDVYIKQSRDGVVNKIEVKACDGYASEAYRQSLISAIKRASPLPLAPSDDVFKNELIFIFKPN